MNTLVFNNPGAIDIRGACIAGLSAKETKSPIGYFGTGLKYSIACILRWGGEITIYSGTTKYVFGILEGEYRGQAFKQIVMDGQGVQLPLGFTTEYGKNWEPWQVFRELYANARDENGNVSLVPFTDNSLDENETTIIVSGVPDLIELFYERDEIIIPLNKQWNYESNKIQFNSAQTNGIYYRGVRVENRACLFTWNFLQKLELTEDRTLKTPYLAAYLFDGFLVEHLHSIELVMQIIELKYTEVTPLTHKTKRDGEMIETTQRPIEAMFMDWFVVPDSVRDYHSTEFKEACVRLYQGDSTTYRALRPYIKSIDSKLVEERQHILTVREQQMFDKAKELVALFGFETEINQLPIFVQDLGGLTLGLYEHGTIYLSPKLFDQGTKQLIATLYEECYHHRTQNTDCTYNMQTDLFNIIISLNEDIHKVIC